MTCSMTLAFIACIFQISICNNQGGRSCAAAKQEVAINFGPGCHVNIHEDIFWVLDKRPISAALICSVMKAFNALKLTDSK